MGSITHNQGERHILSTYFQDQAFTGPFYVGLATGGAIINESTTLEDITEVEGGGYSRKAISRSSSPSSGWTLIDDDYVQSPELVFKNTSGTAWTDIDYAFLTLSAIGTNPPAILIASVDLPETVTLEGNRTLTLTFKFRQSTTYSHTPRFHHGTASFASDSGLIANGVIT